MRHELFIKIVSEFLVKLGFEKKGSLFYRQDDDIIYIIGLQKSKHSKGYYLNLGYVIKELHPNLVYPKDLDGDIRTRFSLTVQDKEMDIIEIDKLSSSQNEYIKEFLRKNIRNLIDGVEENGIKWLLDKDPTLLYQTSLKAKEHLNLR